MTRMAPERPNPNGRPLKPSLASNRTAKTPVTPRLAVAGSVPGANIPQSSRTVRSNNATTPRLAQSALEEGTPFKPFLASNITPRSSSRKSRGGFGSPTSTPSATPLSTPLNSRPTSTVDFPPREPFLGVNASGVSVSKDGTMRALPGQNYTQTTPLPRLPSAHNYAYSPAELQPGRPLSSTFFHANDTRPQEPAPSQKKGPVFFYADGKQDESLCKEETPSPPLSAVGRLQPETQFFHVDSLLENKDQTPVSTAPSVTPASDPLTQSQHALFRAPSPVKEWSHLSYRKGASQIIRPPLNRGNSTSTTSPGAHVSETSTGILRRASVTSGIRRASHIKSASVSSIDSISEPRKISSPEQAPIAPSPLHTETRSLSDPSLSDSIPSIPSPQAALFFSIPSPGPVSPTKPSTNQSTLDVMNELAANARRERKVLDLEISNSSLLAINRSLEKEVRKQKAELRRFRRMSRAGRFSIDATRSMSEVFSLADTDLNSGNLSDMSEGEEGDTSLTAPLTTSFHDHDEEDENSDSSLSESALTPTALASRDASHALRDEKRLQLDLSRHRELLVDSQKVNQSLKRCLTWTEQMIRDAQKALDYAVRPSDVRLGGRVLVRDDEGAEDADGSDAVAGLGESRGLLSPWSPIRAGVDVYEARNYFEGAGVHVNAQDVTAALAERVPDRDSGVDMDAVQHLIGERRANGGARVLDGEAFEERIRRLQDSIELLAE